jgi:putative ABC transport system substrate-binding protein
VVVTVETCGAETQGRHPFPWNANRIRALAQELVSLQPDIILPNGIPATAALQRETRTLPIVFANVSDPVAAGIVARLDRPDPVGSGFVAGLNQPGGNITCFGTLEPSLGGKWLELLLEIAPGLKRAPSCSIQKWPTHRLIYVN